MTEQLKIEAYCVKCKTKREMEQPLAVFTAKAQPAMQGICPVCGTKMFSMGRTTLHDNLQPPTPPQPSKPTAKLVIVESPTKARTVGRFLGKGYIVKASVGHVRDLLRSQLSVDVDHDFTPKYRVPDEKRKVVKELTELVKEAADVYLATDPDREGEAIAWHLSEVLKLRAERTHRVVFHEITQQAVDEAFTHPRDLNMDLVNAQQARRILDRLVGYNLSPLLWRKVRSRLSAGRVQSVALRMIIEREREIESFIPEEYWTLDAELTPHAPTGREKPRSFKARLVRIRGEEVALHSEDEVKPLLEALEKALYTVSKIKEGRRVRKPPAPYTTSTLQQEASRKLGYTARKTMQIAQQLYEGLDVGDGELVGLITYMRTDSTNVAQTAQDEARRFITAHYGAEFLPAEPPVYKTRVKGAQEAHEAIRPTGVLRLPDNLKPHLSTDQFKLYDLIWRRFVASQMEAAVYDTLSVEILAGTVDDKPYLFRASGRTLRFPGFLVVYEEANADNEESEKAQQIPQLTVDEILDLIRLWPEQHFTQPPPRYSDATLIKALEEHGIGRPSTYATILSTIEQRGYVRREARRFFPTKTGFVVNDMLVESFPDLINVDFTARMESDLDDVAEGTQNWVALVHEFYGPFKQALTKAEEAIPVMEEIEYVGRPCPECGEGQLRVRYGRYGKFIACSNFPRCRHTEPWLEKIGVKCPRCGDGDIVEKRTRKRRIFYGCSAWPTCEFTSWKRPLPAPCPACGGLLVIARKDVATCLACGKEVALESLETTPVVESITP